MIGDRNCYVIAEAGVNHNGDVAVAVELVDAAAQAGADAVKFQTFNPQALAAKGAPKAEYQQRDGHSSDDQLAMLARLVLSKEDHHRLQRHCVNRGIDFLSSPFDPESARFLCEDLDLPWIKLGSGEITNAPLLLQIARSGKPVMLSTGMATLEEVEEALGVLAFGYLKRRERPQRGLFRPLAGADEARQVLREKVCVMHCTSEYPCPASDVNLRAMDRLREAFCLSTGYSDHTEGVLIPIAAVARGARVIEKHFTLDRDQAGPDHKASIEPDALAEMVMGIRLIEQALGRTEKGPTEGELEMRKVSRKSLIAARKVAQGELFGEANLLVKRPGTGCSPMDYWDVLGTESTKDYEADEVIA